MVVASKTSMRSVITRKMSIGSTPECHTMQNSLMLSQMDPNMSFDLLHGFKEHLYAGLWQIDLQSIYKQVLTPLLSQ